MDESEKFTEQEQQVLKMMFKMFSAIIDPCEYLLINNDTFDCNDLYHLKEKIGIQDYD